MSSLKISALVVCVFAVAHPWVTTNGAELTSARVTQIINDVKLLPGHTTPRAAIVNDSVDINTAVRTGADSRTELTFSDLTITRLGANTVFSFNRENRQVQLSGGAVLVQVPRNGADVKIRTAAVTAAVSGGTALFESNKSAPAKLLMMEGVGRFYRNGHPEEAVIVHGGEMAMMTPDGRITRPTKFNAALVYKTSKLITSFPTLPNADLISAVINDQQAELAGGPATTSGPPQDTTGIDATTQATAANPISPGGPPTKFGSPALIVDDPYHLTSGTAINTDPTITTGGITNFGKIFRSAAIDGPIATWLGSSPIPFDSVDVFDSTGGGFNDPDTVPIVAFLFNGLSLDGDPTVSNSSNFPTLVFVTRNSIGPSVSGTTFSFGGMKDVAFVSLNGSINLSGLGFANFGELFVYARGGDLTMEAPVSNLDKVTLRSVNTIELHSPLTVNHSFKALAGNTFNTSSTTTANEITVQSLGSINISNTSQLLGLITPTSSNGRVIIIASGDNGAANVGGTIQADQGEVDIRQTGTAGQTTIDSATIHGDIVKISALGQNGTLTIGTGNVIDASTILKLYAPASNGRLLFISSVTLSSPINVLAADTISISPGVVVTIQSPQPADIFTNHPNYFNFGGTGNPANSGTFGGAGAKNPAPLANAPPLGGPGQGQ